MKLWQLTNLIRSKNAGPFELTFDVIFKNRECFDIVQKSNILSAENISKLYAVPLDEVRVFALVPILAVKASIPRPVFSGDLNDTDIYGGQFHSRLVCLEIKDSEEKREPGAVENSGRAIFQSEGK
jgi:hypothetical protein